jgi:uncharacterized protein (DUF1778 family)
MRDMKTGKIFTKKRMTNTAVRVAQSDIELMRAAAAWQGVSQSEFFRLAIREKARRVLLDQRTEDQQATNAG